MKKDFLECPSQSLDVKQIKILWHDLKQNPEYTVAMLVNG